MGKERRAYLRAMSGEDIISQASHFCANKPAPFRSDAEILEEATALFDLRMSLYNVDKTKLTHAATVETNLKEHLHRRLKASSSNLHFIKKVRELHLSRIEVELLLLFTLSELGMIDRVSDTYSAQRIMCKKGGEALKVAQALHEEGKLARSGLLSVSVDEIMDSMTVQIAADFLCPFLKKRSSPSGPWSARTYQKLLDSLYLLVKLAYDRANNIDQNRTFNPRTRILNSGKFDRVSSTISYYTRTLWDKLEKHPRWPLNALRTANLEREEKLIVLVLIGKELGFFPAHDALFTGDGLSCCVSRTVTEIRYRLELLRSDKPLYRNGFIRVSGGADDNAALQDDEALRQCEFEVTPRFLEKLKIRRRRRSINAARKPLMRPGQLVLSQDVQEALDMIAAQARHGEIMLDEWGLRRVIPYGNNLTALFSGPPGVGKTACAEALAYRLKKPILVANYSEIQDCWVGNTEKNIVRVFREAAEAEAVLFWDEADAMFYDRETAMRTWESRDVNVLLQEIEKFKGLCILSTNRKIALDKALERRIALKVEFRPPDREMRRQIWRKLIPEKLPLARNVSLDKLSEDELTGGQIKNVVLNAARLALKRRRNPSVKMQDFRRAIEMEKEGGWNGERGTKIGFVRH